MALLSTERAVPLKRGNIVVVDGKIAEWVPAEDVLQKERTRRSRRRENMCFQASSIATSTFLSTQVRIPLNDMAKKEGRPI